MLIFKRNENIVGRFSSVATCYLLEISVSSLVCQYNSALDHTLLRTAGMGSGTTAVYATHGPYAHRPRTWTILLMLRRRYSSLLCLSKKIISVEVACDSALSWQQVMDRSCRLLSISANEIHSSETHEAVIPWMFLNIVGPSLNFILFGTLSQCISVFTIPVSSSLYFFVWCAPLLVEACQTSRHINVCGL